MQQVNVLTIDPSRLCREGLRRVLAGSEFAIVAEADSIAGMPANLSTTIDLIIVDPGKPNAESLAALTALRTRLPTTRIVVLSADLEAGDAARFLEAGADGCLQKETAVEMLQLYFGLVMVGEKVVSGQFTMHCLRMAAAPVSSVSGDVQFDGLTGRQREIVQHLVDGASNKVIANRLGITEATVKVHLKTIMKKTRAANRTQVAMWASRLGLPTGTDAL
jgi:two-component system, NarL family, nitrate/nitrite response regulator NarL